MTYKDVLSGETALKNDTKLQYTHTMSSNRFFFDIDATDICFPSEIKKGWGFGFFY